MDKRVSSLTNMTSPNGNSVGVKVVGVAALTLISLVIALQVGLFVSLLAFLDTNATPGGFGAPLNRLLPIRDAILSQQPAPVLARLDGQQIGVNDDATVWNALLSPLVSVRFLDAVTEVYPTTPSLYLSRACTGAGKIFALREPSEGCYALSKRTPEDFDPTLYTPIKGDMVVRFANGIRLIGYRWGEPGACLALAWTVESVPESGEYTFAVHFTDPAGREIVIADGLTWLRAYWIPGDTIVRTFCVTDPANASLITGVNLGVYRLEGATPRGIDLIDANGTPYGQSVHVALPR